MNTILFTAIGRRVQLLRYFRQHGFRLIGVDTNIESAAASKVVDICYQVPLCTMDNYVDTLIDICKKEDVSCLIPLYEPELELLARHRHSFSEIGVDLIVSENILLQKVLDKFKLYQWFKKIDIRTPLTLLPDEICGKDITNNKWVIKPRRGMGSKDVFFAEGDDIKKYISQVESPLIQEFIMGDEYSIDAFVSYTGEVCSIVPRKRLEVKGGEVSKSVTCTDTQIEKESLKILKQRGFYGPITMQGILSPITKRFYFIEINPRFGGGTPLSMEAGIPYASFIKKKKTLDGAPHPYTVGLKMLRFDDAYYVQEGD